MVEVLRTAAELLADLPDNTSQLIQPVNNRNMVVGLATDIGVLEEETPFSIPIIDGTPVIINPLLPAPTFDGRPWVLDGGQAMFADWAAIGVSVLGPLDRLIDLRAYVVLLKQGGGVGTYDFQFFTGGIPLAQPITLEIGITQEQITLFSDDLYDHFTALPVDLRVTGVGTSDDLDVTEFSMRLIGAIL